MNFSRVDFLSLCCCWVCCCFAFVFACGSVCVCVLALRVHLKRKKTHSFAIFIHANERISTAIKLYTVYLLLVFLFFVHGVVSIGLCVGSFFVTLLLSIDCLKMQMQIDIQNTFRFVTFQFISTNGFRTCFWFKTFTLFYTHIYTSIYRVHGHQDTRTHLQIRFQCKHLCGQWSHVQHHFIVLAFNI